MSVQEVQATDPDNLPIRDTDSLLKRIGALDEEQQVRLRELWHGNGLGEIAPLVTTDELRKMERLVQTVEHSITGPETWQRQKDLELSVDGLPGNIRTACLEALDVFAGVTGFHNTITTTGRLLEAERIVAEALGYAAEIEAAKALHPSSLEALPPIDQPTQVEVAAVMSDYPGPKAKSDEVLAWVGDDRNRAARAWMHEHTDRKARKGVVDKLRLVLGPDGVVTVNEAMAAAEPPPMNLSATPLPAGAAGNTGDLMVAPVPGAGADEVPPSSDESVDAHSPGDDVTSPAPEELLTVGALENFISPAARRAELYRTIADAFAELAVTG